MPMQWLHVLVHPDIKDKGDCFFKLQYQYTVTDVYDLLECLYVLNAYKFEAEKDSKNK